MDAAYKYFNKTVLFLATVLLIVVPGRAQTFNLNSSLTNATAVTLGNQGTQVSVASSDGTTAIAFLTATTYTNAPTSGGWLNVSGALTTPTNLSLAVGTSAGMQVGLVYSATVTLTSTNVSPTITGTIDVSFTFGSSSNGGTLTPSTTSVVLSAASGASTSAQITLTNNTGNAVTFPAPSITTNTGGNWLTATANSYTVASLQFTTLTIAVPNGLTLASGTYIGTVTITPNGGTSSLINVTFTVGTGTGTGNLTASLSSLSWSYTTNSGAYPAAQTVGLTSSIGLTTYSANVGSTWLYANGSYPSTTGNISSGVIISPDQSYMNALPTGNYTGSVLVFDQNNNQVTITINLVVNGGAASGITWLPNPVVITAASGVVQQQLTVALNSATSGTFSASITGSGLSVSQVFASTTTPAAASVIVYGNPSNLTAATYNGYLYVTLTPTSGTAVNQTIPVSFVVGSGGTTTTTGMVTPTSLTFAYQTSSNISPPSQTLVVSGTGTFTVSTPTYPTGQSISWLTLNPNSSGSAPGTISVTANPAGLAANTSPYTATVAVTPYSGAAAITVSVSFLVTGSPVVVANPGTLNFTYNSGNGSTYSPLYLTASDNSNMPLSVTTSANWLSVSGQSSTTTGAVVSVQANNPGSLANGVYTGSITVTATGAANSPVNVPVVLTVTGSTVTGGGSLTLGTLNSFAVTQGGTAPASQTLSVSASSQTYFTASASSTGSWLQISASSGYTNSTLTVSVIQSALSSLTAGSYPGTITLVANGIQQTVNVTLLISSTTTGGNVTVTANNGAGTPSFNFAYMVGGSAPASQTLQVVSASGSAAVSFTISSSATWLSTGLQNGASVNTPYNNPGFTISIVTPITLSPSATPYSATITITPNGGTTVSVPVTLTVSAAPTVTVTSATTLSFSYQAGGTSPTPATVTVSGGGQSLTFSAAVTSGSNWLSVSPASGTTPTTGTFALTVTATPGTLGAGTYNGAILISGTGSATGSTSINVSLTVTAPLPTILSVVNAASSIGGTISPGEIVSIYGTAIGPAVAAYATIDPSTGKLATTIGGVQVLFNGIPAPLFYASNTQVNAVVPYEMAPISSPSVWIKYVGQTSNAYPLTSATTMPGIFTQNSQGSGPGAILNQDNSVNGPSAPAARGSIVQIFMTGEGQTSPQGVTGRITTASLPAPQVTPAPLLPIGVLINGQPALYTYAGEAPGFAAGLMQLNVQIPPNAIIPAGQTTANLSIVVSIGTNSSQSNVTVSVR